jgi:hypothetical protein
MNKLNPKGITEYEGLELGDEVIITWIKVSGKKGIVVGFQPGDDSYSEPFYPLVQADFTESEWISFEENDGGVYHDEEAHITSFHRTFLTLIEKKICPKCEQQHPVSGMADYLCHDCRFGVRSRPVG